VQATVGGNFRILSLEGGGIKGAFTASLLASFEEELSDPIGAYFDLIAGTSTGGIIALGLALGIRAAELSKFYEDYGPKIFPRSWMPNWLRQGIIGKYSPRQLKAALQSTFGDAQLGAAKTRLLIPAFDVNSGKIYIFKTPHHKRFTKDQKRSMVDVAMATAAAPTFFPRHELPNRIPLIDGGIWANNPVGLAVTEAIAVLGQDPRSLRILSIGCPVAPLSLPRRRLTWGLTSYGLKALIDLFMTGQSHGAYGIAKLFAGEINIERICPPVATGRDALDDCREIPSLIALGQTEGREMFPRIKDRFFSNVSPKYVPTLG